ncbi:MAG: hypothetical protein AMXMBFR36_17060 [Acidobacteriota bacterium]
MSMLPAIFGWIALTGAAASPPPSVHLEARVHGKQSPDELAVVAIRQDRVDQGEDRRTVSLRGGSGRISLDRGAWKLSVESPGFWSKPSLVALDASDRDRTVTLDVWPTTTLVATLRPEGMAKIEFEPGGGPRLRFEPSVAGSENPEAAGEAACAFDPASSRVSCPLPVGRRDVSIAARGFVAKYAWGVEAREPGGVVDLGTLTWMRGASLAGGVELPPGHALDPKVLRIYLRPAGVAPTRRGDERAERLTRQGAVSPRGRFHFDDLAAGRYELWGEQAQLRSGRLTVDVYEARESQMRDPLRLQPPVSLRVSASPPTPPNGGAWTVRIAKGRLGAGGSFARLGLFPVSPEGEVTVPDLVPGPHYLELLDEDGHPWIGEEIEVVGGAETVDLWVDAPWVEGTVTLGRAPLAAELLFGGLYGAEQVEIPTDEQGEFVGVLPRLGPWSVFVRSEEPPLERTVRVEVEEPPGGGVARLDIRLTDSHLPIRVVREDGSPAEAIVTTLERISGSLPEQVETDTKGRVVLRGLSEGDYEIRAEGEIGSAEPVVVAIREGRNPEVTLVLVERDEVVGEVRSLQGPVSGGFAHVVALGAPGLGNNPRLRIGADGTVRVHLPKGVRQVSYVVGAPGYALAVGSAPVVEGRFTVVVDPVGADLRLLLPEAANDWERYSFVAFHRGGSIHGGLFRTWISFQVAPQTDPEAALVPAVESGEWVFCRLPGAAVLTSNAPASPEQGWRCEQVWLQPLTVNEVSVR